MKNFFPEKEVKALKKRLNNRKVQVNHKFIIFLGILTLNLTQCMIHIRASEKAHLCKLAAVFIY